MTAALAHLEVWIGTPRTRTTCSRGARRARCGRPTRVRAAHPGTGPRARLLRGLRRRSRSSQRRPAPQRRQAGDPVLEAAAAAGRPRRPQCTYMAWTRERSAGPKSCSTEADALVDALPDDALAGRLETLVSLATSQLTRTDPPGRAAERGLRFARETGRGFPRHDVHVAARLRSGALGRPRVGPQGGRGGSGERARLGQRHDHVVGFAAVGLGGGGAGTSERRSRRRGTRAGRHPLVPTSLGGLDARRRPPCLGRPECCGRGRSSHPDGSTPASRRPTGCGLSR